MVTDAFPWLLVIAIGAFTFLMRLSFLQLFAGRTLPESAHRLLRFVPAAVLAAIVAPAVVYGGPHAGLSWENTRLLPAVLAVVVAVRTRSALWTIGAGMGALWLLEWAVG